MHHKCTIERGWLSPGEACAASAHTGEVHTHTHKKSYRRVSLAQRTLRYSEYDDAFDVYDDEYDDEHDDEYMYDDMKHAVRVVVKRS